MKIPLIFRKKYVDWNDYIGIAKERTIYVDRDKLRERGWDHVL